jgi:hypothetical protein
MASLFEDLPPEHPVSLQLQGMLGLKGARAIAREPSGKLNFCYWNVLARKERKKGELVFGWRLEWFPGVLACATHHGVWRSPTGKLRDVTPTNGSSASGRTTFVQDDTMPAPDLSWPVLIACKFIGFHPDPLLQEWQQLYSLDNQVQRKMVPLLRSIGWTWTPGSGWQAPAGPRPEFPSELRKLNEAAAEIQHHFALVRAAVAAKYRGATTQTPQR